MQLLRCAAREASSIKYWSQTGRKRCSLAKSNVLKAVCNSERVDDELKSRTCARSANRARPEPFSYNCRSLYKTNFSKSIGSSCRRKHLSRYLCHRRLTGASTLTRRKNGRRRSRSNVEPSQISAVTQRSFHLRVTNSRSFSIFSNLRSVRALIAVCASPARPLGSLSNMLAALLTRYSGLKPSFWIRKSAIACFPAQTPSQTVS